MADFTYDEMVTAQSLNEIAVDLGVGDFSVFSDNTPYAVGKLNEITQSLVGSGISSALDMFEITVNSENIVIGTGIAFFASGKKLKLTMPVTLSFMAGELYLYEELSTGKVSINIGELPLDNYIHIATINEDATYTDRRMIAKAKVELPTEGNSYYKSKLITSEDELYHGAPLFTLSTEGISKIFIVCGSGGRWIYDVNTSSASGVYNRDGEYEYGDNSNGMYIYWLAGTPRAIITLTANNKNDNSITFSLGVNGTSGGLMSAIDFLKNNPIEFYAFGGVL